MTHRIARRILAGLLMLLTFSLVLAPPAAAQDEDEESINPDLEILIKIPGPTNIRVETLLKEAQNALGELIVMGKNLDRLEVTFLASARLTFPLLKEVLAVNEIELLTKEVGGRRIHEALLQRDIARVSAGANRFIQPRAGVYQRNLPESVPEEGLAVEDLDQNAVDAVIGLMEGEGFINVEEHNLKDVLKTFQAARSIPQSGKLDPATLKQMKQMGSLPPGDELVTAVYPIRYADGNGLFAAIRGLINRDPRRLGSVVYVRGSEVLVISDLASNVRYYGQIVQALDIPGPELLVDVIPLKFAAAPEVAALLNEIINAESQLAQATAASTGGEGGKPIAGARPVIVADERTNHIIVVAFANQIERLKTLLLPKLDIEVPEVVQDYHIYHVQNAEALQLASKLNELFTGVATDTSSTRRTTGTNRTGRTTRAGRNDTTGGANPAANRTSTTVGAGNTLNPALNDVPLRIVADEQTNSLLIQASSKDYAVIRKLLTDLDKKPKRVLIEALVYEISITADWTLAFELAYLENPAEDSIRGAGATSFGLSTVGLRGDEIGDGIQRIPFGSALAAGATAASGGALPTGLSTLVFKDVFDEIPLIMQALASDNDAKLITTPFALTNDQQTATFELSDEFPFQTSALSGSGISQSSFDFATATTSLSVTPRIASDNNLTLEVELSIEGFTGSPPVEGAPPPKNSRNYSGVVTIPNRKYVVFGGLEREQINLVKSKVPLLGDIPILGYLFGSTTKTRTKTRVYIFIRPVIMADEEFSTMLKESEYMHRRARSQVPFRPRPIAPDAVLDAIYGEPRAEVLSIFRGAGLLQVGGSPDHPFHNEGRHELDEDEELVPYLRPGQN